MSDVNEPREHSKLPPEEIRSRLEGVKEGDELLFNDRKKPLEVEDVDEHEIKVVGPLGGEYVIYRYDPDHPDTVTVENLGTWRRRGPHLTVWWVELVDGKNDS